MYKLAKRGREYIVKNIPIEDYVDSDIMRECPFKVGDIVIPLENSDVPYLVKKEVFNGSFCLKDYDPNDYYPLIYEEEFI